MTTTLDANPFAPTGLLDTARKIQRQADHAWRNAGRAHANAAGLFHVLPKYPRLVSATTAREWAVQAAALELESRMLEMEAWALYQERRDQQLREENSK